MSGAAIPVVRRATKADAERIGEVLSDAFRDYPWTRWTVDARDHRQRIAALQRLSVEQIGLPFGEVWVATLDDVIEAAAVWMHSASSVPADVLTAMEDDQRSLEGRRHDASRAADEAVSHLRPAYPHYYLGAVGTSSRHHRRGLATAVLAPVLAEADRSVTHAFLETCSIENLRFYGSLGFTIADEVRVPGGGPQVWALVRPPR